MIKITISEQKARDMLQNIAKDIQAKLPPKFGFTLLAYEFGDKQGELLDVSNGDRENVQKAMLEFCTKVKEEDYGTAK